MENRIRIKDIAEKAGVSTGTVDRVIHERGNVSDKARQKVLQVMNELGYERNIMASTLAYNRSFRIAVLLPDYQSDIYWGQPKQGVEKAQKTLQHYGVGVDFYFFDLFDPNGFLDRVREMWKNKPDGILFAPVFLQESQQLLKKSREEQIPNVMINTRIETDDSLCYIGQNSWQSGTLAARLLDLLLEDGQSALLLNLARGVTNAQHLLDKEKGFREYFAQSNTKHIQIINRNFSQFQDDQKLSVFLSQLLKDYPNTGGIFVTNSRVYRVAKCLNRRLSERIKLVGFDLIEPNLKLLKQGRVHFIINQNPVQQGYLGVVNLVNHLILKQKVEPIQYLPLDIVMKENVEYYLRREQSFQMII
jgi:LacI family transcriptional regulator